MKQDEFSAALEHALNDSDELAQESAEWALATINSRK